MPARARAGRSGDRWRLAALRSTRGGGHQHNHQPQLRVCARRSSGVTDKRHAEYLASAPTAGLRRWGRGSIGVGETSTASAPARYHPRLVRETHTISNPFAPEYPERVIEAAEATISCTTRARHRPLTVDHQRASAGNEFIQGRPPARLRRLSGRPVQSGGGDPVLPFYQVLRFRRERAVTLSPPRFDVSDTGALCPGRSAMQGRSRATARISPAPGVQSGRQRLHARIGATQIHIGVATGRSGPSGRLSASRAATDRQTSAAWRVRWNGGGNLSSRPTPIREPTIAAGYTPRHSVWQRRSMRCAPDRAIVCRVNPMQCGDDDPACVRSIRSRRGSSWRTRLVPRRRCGHHADATLAAVTVRAHTRAGGRPLAFAAGRIPKTRHM